MDGSSFFTTQQLKVFGQDLPRAFVEAGFDIFEEPYIDHALYGFRATYIRRYLLHKPTNYYDGILTTLVHVVGIPYGRDSQKMVVLSVPRNIKNEPISDSIKLRIQIDENGLACVAHGNDIHYHQWSHSNFSSSSNFNEFNGGRMTKANSNNGNNKYASNTSRNENQSNQQQNGEASSTRQEEDRYSQKEQFANDLASYVSHIIEIISPGLIQLPTEMKLEILKKLSVDSIIKMSQVNSEFRSIIFQHGETLWRHLCLRDFNIRKINRKIHRYWIELYRDSYVRHEIEVCRKERALPGLPERPALPPVPYRLQIGWLPAVLELPFYPLEGEIIPAAADNQLQLALELFPF